MQKKECKICKSIAFPTEVIVNGVTHCGECADRKNLTGTEKWLSDKIPPLVGKTGKLF